ncbi:MAG: TonB-dependent siderophore receptor [Methylococcales bacterium]
MTTIDNLKFTGEDILLINQDRQQKSHSDRGRSRVETSSTNGLHWSRRVPTRKSVAIAAAFMACIPLAFVGAEPAPVSKAATTAEAPVQFDIPAQDLARALSAFAAQSHVQVLYEGDIAKGLRSTPLKGAYTPEKAAQVLLTDTPVRARFTGARTVTVEREAIPVQNGSDAGDDTALGKVTVSATAKYDANDPYNPDYNRPNASTATRTDTPIMETPVSIEVVTQQVLKDQQAIGLNDALKNVSGVVPQFGFGYREGFVIRGFETRDFQRRDGFLIRETRQPLANVDRVEVLKGPAAILYGNIEPGGLINLVTKRPQTESYYSLSQQFGSFDTYRTLADATGPISSDGSLSYRLNFEYLDQDSFRDFVSVNRKLVAPSLTWRNDRTQVDLDFFYQNEDNFIDDGIPALGNRPAKVPRSRFLGEALSDTNTVNYVPAVTITHQLDDDWRVRARYQAEITDGFYTDIGQFGLNEATGDINRFAFIGRFNQHSHFGNLDLTGKFSTWGLGHTLLIGGDYYDYKYLEIDNFFDGPPFVTGPINIFNPIYGMIPENFKDQPPNDSFGARQSWYGLYLQDQIAIGEHWHLLAGFRYDDVTTTQLRGFPVTELPEVEARKFSPRVGVLYRPVSWLSLFGSYTEGFNVRTFSRDAKPQFSHQYEAGVKTDFYEGRLTGTLTYYNLTKTNIQTPTGIPNVFQTSGEVRNQGVELDLSGALTDDWRLIGTFSYIDSEITKDQNDSGGPGNQGNRLVNVPRYSGSLWTTYEFGGLGLPGLTAGAGAFFVGQREGDNANTFQLPGYGRVDLLLGYSRTIGPTKASVQFNIENLLDKEYFVSSANRNNILPGVPRTFLGLLRIEY